MKAVSSMISGTPLLPILQPASVDEALHIAEAVYHSGLRSIEVVRRTDAAAASVSAIREHFPELLVGLGTILTKDHVQEAKDAGSQFIITPTLSPSLLQHLVDAQVPFLPGTSSASDILLAIEAGLSEVKFFPATLCGGVGMLKNFAAIFPDVKICPTGGISGTNVREFAEQSNVFAIGGSWMIPKGCIADANWQGITAACLQAQQEFTGDSQ